MADQNPNPNQNPTNKPDDQQGQGVDRPQGGGSRSDPNRPEQGAGSDQQRRNQPSQGSGGQTSQPGQPGQPGQQGQQGDTKR